MFWPRTIVTSQIQAGARVFGRAGWVFFIIAILTTLVPAQAQADELNKAQWLMRQSEQAFSLQLVTLSSKQQIERFVAEEPALKDYPVAYYRYQKEGQLLYVVTLGVFADAASAQQVKESLQLGRVAPEEAWIRPLDEIQAQVRTTLQR
jgi:septal ring-binding cell division protein DamX